MPPYRLVVSRHGSSYEWRIFNDVGQVVSQGTAPGPKPLSAQGAAEQELCRLQEEQSVQPPIRIYFDGCEGSGKTSLSAYVRDAYGIPMINEAARQVLADWGKTFSVIRASGRECSEYQRAVFQRQVENEKRLAPPYVSDRTLGNLGYAAEFARNFRELFNAVPSEYLANLRNSIVFLVRPQRALRQAAGTDPFRLLSEWEGQVRIDAVIETLLQLWDVPYLPIAEADSAHREAFIDWALQARGFKKHAS